MEFETAPWLPVQKGPSLTNFRTQLLDPLPVCISDVSLDPNPGQPFLELVTRVTVIHICAQMWEGWMAELASHELDPVDCRLVVGLPEISRYCVGVS